MQISAGRGSNEVALEGPAGAAVTVWLSQTNQALARWRVRLQAQLGADFFDVATFYTSPPRSTSPIGSPARAVAVACIPGAKNWKAIVSCANIEAEGVKREIGDFNLASCEGVGEFGLKRVGERYAYLSGSGTHTVTIQFGQSIKSWGALASLGVDGSVQIGAGDTIIVPNGDAAAGDPDKTLQGKFDFTFDNVEYFIELLESA